MISTRGMGEYDLQGGRGGGSPKVEQGPGRSPHLPSFLIIKAGGGIRIGGEIDDIVVERTGARFLLFGRGLEKKVRAAGGRFFLKLTGHHHQCENSGESGGKKRKLDQPVVQVAHRGWRVRGGGEQCEGGTKFKSVR